MVITMWLVIFIILIRGMEGISGDSEMLLGFLLFVPTFWITVICFQKGVWV